MIAPRLSFARLFRTAALATGLVAAVGCQNQLTSRAEMHTDHGAAFVAEDEALIDQLVPDTEDGWSRTPVFAADGAFDRVALRYDAEGVAFVEGRVSTDGGATFTAWQRLMITYVDGVAHNAHFDVDTADATHAQLRFIAPVESALSFVAVDLIEAAHDVDAAEAGGFDVDSTAENEGALAADSAGVITRSQWGARSRNCRSPHTPSKLTIHHTATPNNDRMTMPARLRQIQAYHIDNRGWCDIGYHFLVGQDGKVYQGRPENHIAAHAAGANRHNVGISFIGNFTSIAPGTAQFDAGARIVRAMADTWNIPLNRTAIRGHRQVGSTSTSCPGNALYPRLEALVAQAAGTTPVEPEPAGCRSGTLGRDVEAGTCVQVNYAGCGLLSCAWYRCDGGWQCSELDDCAADTYAHTQCDAPDPVQPEPTEPDGSYTDVPADHWAAAAIDAVVNAGIMSPCTTSAAGTQFCPQGTVSRRDAARSFDALFTDSPALPANPVFDDVSASDPDYIAVQRMAVRGISYGCGAGQFCPSGTVHRAALAAFVGRAQNGGWLAPAEATFVDVPTTHWAYGHIERLASAGVVNGCRTSPRAFCPGDQVSRAEMAVILKRAYNL